MRWCIKISGCSSNFTACREVMKPIYAQIFFGQWRLYELGLVASNKYCGSTFQWLGPDFDDGLYPSFLLDLEIADCRDDPSYKPCISETESEKGSSPITAAAVMGRPIFDLWIAWRSMTILGAQVFARIFMQAISEKNHMLCNLHSEAGRQIRQPSGTC